MNPTQRAALRTLIQKLLAQVGREEMISILTRRMTGDSLDSRTAAWLEDPLLEPVWSRPETLGWAHQYAQEEEKERVFRRLLKHGQKVDIQEIPAVTQLFTPDWIVQFLVENSLGRLWLEMHPDSELRQRLPWLIPGSQAAHPGTLPSLAREIRVLDPACGAMHFGLSVYDLLELCYREEMTRAGQPGWPPTPSVSDAAEIPAQILEQNLYGLDLDPAVLEVASRAIQIKAGRSPGHLQCLPGPLGALDRNSGPAGLFHIVLTNPPYMARKNATPALAAHLEAEFPEGKGDLYTAFLQRCTEWLRPGGRLGMIAQSSFMFIGSYSGLRARLLEQNAIEAVAHFGPGAFAEISGEKVNTAAFILRRDEAPVRRDAGTGLYLRLLGGGEEEKRRALEEALRDLRGGRAESDLGIIYRTPQAVYRDMPGSPWIYWLPPDLRSRYQKGERAGDHARFCRGITTADNGRFVRYWWEVGLEAVAFGCGSLKEAADSGKRWFPYMKGGGPVRWFGNILHVLDWGDGGAELRAFSRAAVRNLGFQFRQGVTYSSVTGGSVTARWMPSGFLFDQASNALFSRDPADLPVLLALLNHPVAGFTVSFNPTVNIVEADLNRIPWPQTDREAVTREVQVCIDLARQIDEMSELSPFFRQPPRPDQSDLASLILQLERRERLLETILDEGLGLSPSSRRAIRDQRPPAAPALRHSAELKEAWVSYALGILLGRCSPGGYGGRALLGVRWSDLQGLVRGEGQIPVSQAGESVKRVLSVLIGDDGLRQLDLMNPDQYVQGTFLSRHARTYKNRPVYHLRDGMLHTQA